MDYVPKYNLSDKTVLIYDSGASVDLARMFVPQFKKVYYFTPWTQSGFPDFNPRFIGVGIPGVEKIEDFWKVIDNEKVDLIIFTDVYDGDLAEHLRSIGKHVVSSFYAKKFELDRSFLHEYLKLKELPVSEFTPITGMTKLRDFLKDKEDKFVKISNLRGITETIHYMNEKVSLSELDDLSYRLGDLKDMVEFLVQDPIGDEDVIEFGCEAFFTGGRFAENMTVGIEVKDSSYCARFMNTKDIPEPILRINNAFIDPLTEYGYQQHFSTEIRYGKDQKPYFTDSTNRLPHPPSELMHYIYENIAEIYFGLAYGQTIEPVFKYEYGVQVIIHSEWAENHFLAVEIPEKYRENIFLKNYVVVDGTPRIIPQPYKLQEIGAVVAGGKTLEDAIGNVKQIIDEIKLPHCEFPVDKLDTIHGIIETMEKLGVNFYSDISAGEKPEVIEETMSEPVKEPEPKPTPVKVKRFLETLNR